jgi:hypothetical protein
MYAKVVLVDPCAAMNPRGGNVTSLLRAWRSGDARAGERLLEAHPTIRRVSRGPADPVS